MTDFKERLVSGFYKTHLSAHTLKAHTQTHTHKILPNLQWQPIRGPARSRSQWRGGWRAASCGSSRGTAALQRSLRWSAAGAWSTHPVEERGDKVSLRWWILATLVFFFLYILRTFCKPTTTFYMFQKDICRGFFSLFYSPHITVEIIIRDAPINWPGTRIGWFKAWPATSQPDISDSVPDGFIHISPTCQSTDMDREIQIWRKILQMPLFMNMKRAWRRKPGCVELVSYYTPLITYNKYI